MRARRASNLPDGRVRVRVHGAAACTCQAASPAQSVLLRHCCARLLALSAVGLLECKDNRATGGPFAPGDNVVQITGEHFATVRVPFTIQVDVETTQQVQRQAGAKVDLTSTLPKDSDDTSVPCELLDRGGALRMQSTAFSRGNDPPRLSTVLAPGTHRVVATTPTCRGEATIEVAETPVQATVALAPRR
jgi:hypothetical protein